MWLNKFKLKMLLLVTSAFLGFVIAADTIPAVEPKRDPPSQSDLAIARIRDIVKPQADEYLVNLAKVNWETDPYQAALKAAREGKPIFIFGGHAGLSCGYE